MTSGNEHDKMSTEDALPPPLAAAGQLGQRTAESWQLKQLTAGGDILGSCPDPGGHETGVRSFDFIQFTHARCTANAMHSK